MADSRATQDHVAYWKRYRCESCGDINPPTVNCPGRRNIKVETATSINTETTPPGEGWMPASRLDVEGIGGLG